MRQLLVTEPQGAKFSAFVHERHRVYLKRAAGQPAPWTEDAVLSAYRFTNVYRELDTVTQWIAKNWRNANASSPDLWFAMCVARLINWPETLAELPFPDRWDGRIAAKYVKVLTERQHAKKKVFTSAYIINQAVTGGYGVSKAEYLSTVVFPQLWLLRLAIRPREGDTLAAFHARLMQGYGMGSFLAAQVVADTKLVSPILLEAHDWNTWAASGPGSRRGLNALTNRPVDERLRESVWLTAVQHLQKRLNETRDKTVLLAALDAQDVQNCLCEYSKYSRGYSRQRVNYS